MDQRVSPPITPQPLAPDIKSALALDADGKPKARRGRWKRWAIVALLVTGLGYAGWSWQQSRAVTVTYTTTPAATADLIVEVSATGTLQPITKVDDDRKPGGEGRDHVQRLAVASPTALQRLAVDGEVAGPGAREREGAERAAQRVGVERA